MSNPKPNDRVKIISIPIVENNEYGQMCINITIGKNGTIWRVYKHGVRNIEIKIDGGGSNYYSPENLEKI